MSHLRVVDVHANALVDTELLRAVAVRRALSQDHLAEFRRV